MYYSSSYSKKYFILCVEKRITLYLFEDADQLRE